MDKINNTKGSSNNTVNTKTTSTTVTAKARVHAELRMWKNRVQFPNAFKPTTNTTPIINLFTSIQSGIKVIVASSESSVYKVCYELIKQNLATNTDITFINGAGIAGAITGTEKDPKVFRMNLSTALQYQLSHTKSSIAAMPFIGRVKWTTPMAGYFLDQLKSHGIEVLIFWSAGENNLAEVIIRDNCIPGVIEFPKPIYTKAKRQIQDDGF